MALKTHVEGRFMDNLLYVQYVHESSFNNTSWLYRKNRPLRGNCYVAYSLQKLRRKPRGRKIHGHTVECVCQLSLHVACLSADVGVLHDIMLTKRILDIGSHSKKKIHGHTEQCVRESFF